MRLDWLSDSCSLLASLPLGSSNIGSTNLLRSRNFNCCNDLFCLWISWKMDTSGFATCISFNILNDLILCMQNDKLEGSFKNFNKLITHHILQKYINKITKKWYLFCRETIVPISQMPSCGNNKHLHDFIFISKIVNHDEVYEELKKF